MQSTPDHQLSLTHPEDRMTSQLTYLIAEQRHIEFGNRAEQARLAREARAAESAFSPRRCASSPSSAALLTSTTRPSPRSISATTPAWAPTHPPAAKPWPADALEAGRTAGAPPHHPPTVKRAVVAQESHRASRQLGAGSLTVSSASGPHTSAGRLARSSCRRSKTKAGAPSSAGTNSWKSRYSSTAAVASATLTP